MRFHYFIMVILINVMALSQTMAMTRIKELTDDFHSIRDPLLPTDYVQPSEDDQEQARERETQAAQIAWPQFRIRGITHAGREQFVAIIDQIGIVEEGETITLREGHLIYAWRVDRISEAGITTTRMHVTSIQNPAQPMRIWERSSPAILSP